MKKKYSPKESDMAYRKVNLKKAAKEPQFIPFSKDAPVEYDENFVLEVQQEDGSTRLVYEFEKKGIALREDRSDGSRGKLDASCPTERLYIKAVNGETLYKIPDDLPKDDPAFQYFRLHNCKEFELVGDKYMEAAYDLRSAVKRPRQARPNK